MDRLIGYSTYKYYAKKYKIKLSKMKKGKRVLKSMKQLQKEIFKYENANKNIINDEMLYFI